MPIPTDRTTWPHADPSAADQHIADHNAIATLLNSLEAQGTGGGLTQAQADALYAALSHTHAYAPDTHNHDAAYAPAHGHPYASDTHNHDAAYATADHTHPGGGMSGGVLRKTANQTMTATAQTAVTDLAVAVAANSTYFIMMSPTATTSTGTAPTTAWGFTGPAGATVSIVGEIDTSSSVETNAVLTAFGNFAAGAQVANSGARFWLTVQTGATAGTVQLTCARGGTTPSMVIAAGSNGFWSKVA